MTFSAVIEMEYIEIPDIPILRGEEAIRALNNFINELEKERSKELTENQTFTLIKLARGLISSIEADSASNRDVKGKGFVSKLAKAFNLHNDSKLCK